VFVQTILLLCVGASFAFITARSPDELPIDTAIIQFAKYIYESLGKKPTNYITKDEFSEWTKENVFALGITNIGDILETLTNSPETQLERAAAASGKNEAGGTGVTV
jgi:hypothetical protein